MTTTFINEPALQSSFLNANAFLLTAPRLQRPLNILHEDGRIVSTPGKTLRDISSTFNFWVQIPPFTLSG